MAKRIDVTLIIIADDEEFTNSAASINDLFGAIKIGLEKGSEFYYHIPEGGMTAIVSDDPDE